ncbi:hypothetical protein ACMFMG_005072 [Clarireedia jacksonii]
MSFHPFPRLPKELQLAVWTACLGHRVVELDVPDPPGAPGLNGFYINRQPSVLARVCRDSCAVALEHSVVVSSRDAHVFFGSSVNRVSIDCTRDIVHIHWSTLYDAAFGSRGDDPLVYWRTTAALASEGGSITEDAFLEFIKTPGMTTTTTTTTTLAQLRNINKRLRICLKTISIHAEAEVAVDSGLFGRLGEQRVVLVDAANQDHLCHFAAFWERHGSKADRQTTHFFHNYVRDDSWAREAVEELQLDWLVHRWENKDRDLSALNNSSGAAQNQHYQHHSDAWIRRPGDHNEDLERPWAMKLKQLWIPDIQNAWVRYELDSIPELQPTIMFRLCTQRCT